MKKIKYISKLRNESTEQVDKKFYIGLENISKNTGQLIKKNIEDVSGKANLFYKGDLLYSKLRPYLNKCVVATENGFCSTELLVLET